MIEECQSIVLDISLYERVCLKLRKELKEKGRPIGDIKVSIEAMNAMIEHMLELFPHLKSLPENLSAVLEWESRPIIGDASLTGDEIEYRGMKITLSH